MSTSIQSTIHSEYSLSNAPDAVFLFDVSFPHLHQVETFTYIFGSGASLEVVLHLTQLRHNCYGLGFARLLLNLRILLLSAQ
jgi:hypothetical protein